MDSLRLLTRGSGLKFTSTSSQTHQTRPSAGGDFEIEKESSLSGKKRKRFEYENENGETQDLSIEDIRKIQKLHKIKITDLKARQSKEILESRKAQKEASRLFPQPLLKFSSLREKGLHHAVLENMVEQGYRKPTEVQLATIPLLMSDRATEPDLLTIAPTGSGKTLAFLVPLMSKISKIHRSEDSDASQRQVSAIILAPTKELVNQIVSEGRKLVGRTGVRITAFRKGMRLHENITATQQGGSDDESEGGDTIREVLVKADILVTTPLTLLHAITPADSENALPLPEIHSLILDEADVLLDPLFRSQTLSIWSSCTNTSLRSSLWSATIGSNIEELTVSTIGSRQRSLKISSKHRPPLLRCVIGLKDSSLPNITHKLIYCSTEAGKLTSLRQLIRPPPSNVGANSKDPQTKASPLLRPPFLIFTQTITRAQALYSELQYDIPPSVSNSSSTPRIALLHSSLPDSQRTAIMQSFRQGKTWILITTDLLSRGIDLRGLNGIVNYDIPTTPASYVHRAGRTGRAGRKGGVCVTLYTRDDVTYLRPLVNVISKSQDLHRNNGSDDNSNENVKDSIPSWLLDSLPYLKQATRKELKERGVDVRRAVKESDDKQERRRKGRNVIGTKSGYEKRREDRRKGMVEGSMRRKRKEEDTRDEDDNETVNNMDGDDFGGFD